MENCSFDKCSQPPEFLCACEKKPLSFCSEHIDEHYKEDKPHNVTSNCIEITSVSKKMMSIQLTKCFARIRETNESIGKKTNDFINKVLAETVKRAEENRYLEDLYSNVVEFLQMNDKVVKKGNLSKTEEFIIKYQKNPNNIYKELVKSEEKLMQEIDFEVKIKKLEDEKAKLLSESQKKSKEIEELNKEFNKVKLEHQKMQTTLDYLKTALEEPVYLDLIDNSYKNKIMCYFEQSTKNLCLINTGSNADTKLAIDIPDNLSLNSGVCLLPNEKFLYYGGNQSGYTDFAYIVDIEKKMQLRNQDLSKKPVGVLDFTVIILLISLVD